MEGVANDIWKLLTSLLFFHVGVLRLPHRLCCLRYLHGKSLFARWVHPLVCHVHGSVMIQACCCVKESRTTGKWLWYCGKKDVEDIFFVLVSVVLYSWSIGLKGNKICGVASSEQEVWVTAGPFPHRGGDGHSSIYVVCGWKWLLRLSRCQKQLLKSETK